MYKLRNESEETVRRQPVPLSLAICYQQQEIQKINIMNDQTVGDLIFMVRKRLARRFDNIVGLTSVEGYYTLDYALQRHQLKLTGMRNNQKLEILLEDIVADQGCPTLADFNFIACLGQGISASVFLVRHAPSAQLYALKQIKKDYFREFKTLESVLRQKKILTDIVADLPFATKLQASFESQNHLNLLLQFYPGGEFFFHLTQRKLTEEEAKLCFAEVLLTMEKLHQRKVLYRDLKPQNIMVDFEGHLRLGDFGLCRINLERRDLAYSHCGSPEYMAYQTKENEGYSYPADFYTMGAIIYEMVRGVPPFFKGEPLSFEGSSPSFRMLVEDLIRQNPRQRLCDYEAIKKSHWLRNLNWQKLKNRQQSMPTKLNLYTNYIHAQFIQKQFHWEGMNQESRYDRLFDMFFYLRDNPDGISPYYPGAKTTKKGSIAKAKSKDVSRQSSKKKDRDRGDSQSSSSQRSHSKSKSKKQDFFRKNTNRQNIYTVIGPGKITERDRNQVSVKSGSKKKQSVTRRGFSKDKDPLLFSSKEPLLRNKEPALQRNKSPVRFKPMTSVKSSGNLKGSEYLKELDKSASKKKRLK